MSSSKDLIIIRNGRSQLSPFQTKKAAYFFTVNLDLERKGYVTWDDVKFYILFHMTVAGQENDNQLEKTLSTVTFSIWTFIKNAFPDNNDDNIYIEQFLDFWFSISRYVTENDNLPKLLNDWLKAGFQLYDSKGSGAIRPSAFYSLYNKMGVTNNSPTTAFRVLSQANQKPMTFEHIREITKLVITSSDPNDYSSLLLPGFEFKPDRSTEPSASFNSANLNTSGLSSQKNRNDYNVKQPVHKEKISSTKEDKLQAGKKTTKSDQLHLHNIDQKSSTQKKSTFVHNPERNRKGMPGSAKAQMDFAPLPQELHGHNNFSNSPLPPPPTSMTHRSKENYRKISQEYPGSEASTFAVSETNPFIDVSIMNGTGTSKEYPQRSSSRKRTQTLQQQNAPTDKNLICQILSDMNINPMECEILVNPDDNKQPAGPHADPFCIQNRELPPIPVNYSGYYSHERYNNSIRPESYFWDKTGKHNDAPAFTSIRHDNRHNLRPPYSHRLNPPLHGRSHNYQSNGSIHSEHFYRRTGSDKRSINPQKIPIHINQPSMKTPHVNRKHFPPQPSKSFDYLHDKLSSGHLREARSHNGQFVHTTSPWGIQHSIPIKRVADHDSKSINFPINPPNSSNQNAQLIDEIMWRIRPTIRAIVQEELSMHFGKGNIHGSSADYRREVSSSNTHNAPTSKFHSSKSPHHPISGLGTHRNHHQYVHNTRNGGVGRNMHHRGFHQFNIEQSNQFPPEIERTTAAESAAHQRMYIPPDEHKNIVQDQANASVSHLPTSHEPLVQESDEFWRGPSGQSPSVNKMIFDRLLKKQQQGVPGKSDKIRSNDGKGEHRSSESGDEDSYTINKERHNGNDNVVGVTDKDLRGDSDLTSDLSDSAMNDEMIYIPGMGGYGAFLPINIRPTFMSNHDPFSSIPFDTSAFMMDMPVAAPAEHTKSSYSSTKKAENAAQADRQDTGKQVTDPVMDAGTNNKTESRI